VSSARGLTALITGADGQVGRELQSTAPAGWLLASCTGHDLDVTDLAAVRDAFKRKRPDIVFNAAAYTAVDTAEADAERAGAVNSAGAANVALAARENGARMVHLSTDFVFDGRQGHPYAPDDGPNPLSVYGRTKLAGEREVTRISEGAALIVRTAWLYSAQGRNFVLTMLGLMGKQERLEVVSDQTGTPTWTRSLARALWAAAERPGMRGIHHWTDAGAATWYDFAVAIQEEAVWLKLLSRAVPISPVLTKELPRPAARPTYSVLDKTATWKALGLMAPHWRVNLRLMLGELSRG
jgi:dTDP-4-dehydrorhamnose reductase